MMKKVRRLLNQNLIKSFYFNKKFKVRVFPKVNLKIGRKANLILNGSLILGDTFNKMGYLPSMFKLDDHATLRVQGDFTVYSGFRISINEGATLELGSGKINYGLNIACFNKIIIGNNVAISENVTIRDSDNHQIHYSGYQMSKPIIIGDKVLIGLNSTILKGVTIGKGSVIAAGSVVTRDVPDHCLVAGVPARVIKTHFSWDGQP